MIYSIKTLLLMLHISFKNRKKNKKILLEVVVFFISFLGLKYILPASITTPLIEYYYKIDTISLITMLVSIMALTILFNNVTYIKGISSEASENAWQKFYFTLNVRIVICIILIILVKILYIYTIQLPMIIYLVLILVITIFANLINEMIRRSGMNAKKNS